MSTVAVVERRSELGRLAALRVDVGAGLVDAGAVRRRVASVAAQAGPGPERALVGVLDLAVAGRLAVSVPSFFEQLVEAVLGGVPLGSESPWVHRRL